MRLFFRKKCGSSFNILLQTQGGFTLVELLISMFLVLSVTSVVMTIFVAGLRGSSRTTAEIDVRENGDLTMQQMARMIRSAKNFNGVSVDGSTAYTPSCYFDSGFGPTPTPKPYKGVQVTAFDGGVTNITCPQTGEVVIASTSASSVTSVPLTDANEVTVVANSCYFTCQQQSPTDLPVIGISFTMVSNKVSGTAGTSLSQNFQTTVIPRNYLR